MKEAKLGGKELERHREMLVNGEMERGGGLGEERCREIWGIEWREGINDLMREFDLNEEKLRFIIQKYRWRKIKLNIVL